MPYLGPRSFNTTPLTTLNLAYLTVNDDDETNNNNDNNNHNGNVSNNKRLINNNHNPNHNNKFINKINNTSLVSTPTKNKNLEENDLNSPTSTNHNTDSSTNSISSAFSLNSHSLNSSQSSQYSINSNHRTINFNDDDNKTVILSNSNTNTNTNINLPQSPTKSSDIISISTSNVSDQNFLKLKSIPPTPLLRKKSGELLKSSLKLANLQRSNSMPNAKSVRFANRLENVKFFKKSEKPTAVSINKNRKNKTKWDFDSSSSDDNDEEYSDDNDIENNEFNFELNDDYDNCLNDNDDSIQWKILSNDCPYNPLSLNFAKLASNNDVILESIKLNSSGNALIGFVYVKNIAFQKQIIVKLTHDNWKSFIEVDDANYISSNHIFKYSDSNANNYDKFSFIIKIDNLHNFSSTLNIEFCIQYIVNHHSYWDSNDNKNYKIKLVKNIPNSKITKLSDDSFDNTNNTNLKSNSNSTSNSNSKSSSNSKSNSLFDIDGTTIKLKNNNNFMDSKSKPTTDMGKLRTSNSFGLKKIRSESSLSSMKSNFFSEYNNKSTSCLLNSQINIPETSSSPSASSSSSLPLTSNQKNYIPQTSKSLSTSPAAINCLTFDNNSKDNDYENIIKKYCFFNSIDNKQQDKYNNYGLQDLSKCNYESPAYKLIDS